jgi:hypothetical protein
MKWMSEKMLGFFVGEMKLFRKRWIFWIMRNNEFRVSSVINGVSLSRWTQKRNHLTLKKFKFAWSNISMRIPLKIRNCKLFALIRLNIFIQSEEFLTKSAKQLIGNTIISNTFALISRIQICMIFYWNFVR